MPKEVILLFDDSRFSETLLFESAIFETFFSDDYFDITVKKKIKPFSFFFALVRAIKIIL